MAGDWIKMRTDLLTSPKVVRMASALKADRFRIVGGLLSVWSLFDAHSTDGVLSGYTLEALDDLAAWPGFSGAMIDVGWLDQEGETLALPRFDTHNGASAKRRAQDADRKKSVRKMSASDADEKRTREEIEIEIEKIDKSKSTVGQEKPDPVPYAKVMDIYQATCAGVFLGAEKLTAGRKIAIRRAWHFKARGKLPFQDLDFWHRYFERCKTNRHWCGENDRAWKADLEFVLREANIVKVLGV